MKLNVPKIQLSKLYVSLLASLVCVNGSAFAQSLLLEEIVVTAQKRAQSMQDVGIAVTSFTGDQLNKLGVEDSTDIAYFTPGVSLSGSFAGQQRQFSIRGVTQNDFNDHVESPTAIYIDEGYVASQQGQIFAAFDLERVEILKGPQGTLFGRNATGGLVHYITRKPTEEFEGYFDLTIAEYNQTKVETAFGGPLSDKAGYRVAALYNKNDGYLRNEFPEQTFVPAGLTPALSNGLPAPEGTGDDLGGDDTWAIRGQLAIDISDNATLDLSASWSESVQSTGPYQSTPTIAVLDANGNTINSLRLPDGSTEVREFIHPTDPTFDNFFDGDGDGLRPIPGADFYGYRDPDGSDFITSSDLAFDDSNETEAGALTAKFTVALGEMEFVSVTDYKTLEKFHILDLEAGPESQFTWGGEAEIDSFTQELRLSGSTDNNHWVTGLYYLDIDASAASALAALPNGNSIASAGFVNFEQPRLADLQTKSYSIFAQNEFAINESWSLITGLRATREEKSYKGDVLYGVGNVNPVRFEDTSLINGVSTRSEGEFIGEQNDTLITGKLQLDWKAADNILVYMGYNRGVKAGSFNTADVANSDLPYDKEVLHAYELGFKSDLTDTLRFNAAVYYYDYQDYQASRWTGLGNLITNNDATIQGLDFEIISNPVDNLDLMLTVGLVDAEVEDVIVAGIPRDVTPTFAPDTTISALAGYTFLSLISGGDFSMQVSASYQSEVFHNLANFDSTEFDGWTVVDVRAGWESANGNWAVDAFVDNVGDERYNVIGFDLSTICGCNEEAQGKPRWAGVSVRRNF